MNKDIVILREAIKKIVPMLAGKGLTVTQMGTQAYVQPHPVTGLPWRVNIPLLPDNAEPEFVFAIQGFIDHEVAHVLFTDFLFKARDKSKRLHNLHNIIEDTMIERLMSNEFPGSKRNISKLREYFLRNVTAAAIAKAHSKEEEFGYLIVVMMRALAGHVEFQEFMDDNNYWEHELVKPFMQRFSKASQDKMPLLQTTEQTYDIAVEVEAILYPPPPPAPPQPPEPEEQDDQDQGEGSDDQEPSEGEDDKDHSDEQQTGDGEGDGEREHTEDNDKASGGEGESDEEEKEDDAGDGENEGSGEGEEKADDEESDKEPGAGSADDGDDDQDGDQTADEDAGDGSGDKDDADAGNEPEESKGAGSAEEDDADDADDQDGSGSAPDDADGGSEEGGDGSAADGDEASDASEVDEGKDAEQNSSGEPADDADEDVDAEGDESESDAGGSDPDGESEEGEDGDEESGEPLSNVAVEDAGDDEDANDGSASEDEEPAIDVASIGYDPNQNPFAAMDDDALDEKDISSALVKIIVKEAISACRASDYSIFTREYDVIKPLEVPEDFKSRYIVELEEQTRALTGVMQKDIERMMAAQARVFNVAGQRSGRLNSAGLHRLTAGDSRVFSRREEIRAKDTAVSLLSDCSGSMQGRPMATALSASYALASVLERCNIPSECMGFTTAQMWGQGSVMTEDRIRQFNNDLQTETNKSNVAFSRVVPIYMPIFKDFNERLNADVKKRFAYQRKHQPYMGGNIDGESLEYAAMRLARRKEKRKVIIVLSDGFPAGARNDDAHLKHMVERLTNMGYDLVGIGIESDAVARFYDNHIVLQSVDDLPRAVMGELKKILMK
jgi:cobalamin biosynthesis protein CobT